MEIVVQTIAELATGFDPLLYLAVAAVLSLCSFGIWILIRKTINGASKRRAYAALLIAIPLAPSILGIHTHGITLPAILIVALFGTGGLRPVALMWSLASITGTWALVFMLWTGLTAILARNRKGIPASTTKPAA